MCTVPYNTHYYIWIYITTHTLLLRKKYNMTSYTYVGNSLSTFSTEGKQNTSPYLWETNVKSSTACCCITTRYHLGIFQQLSYFKRSGRSTIDYESGHEDCKILTFKVKNHPNPSIFFIGEYKIRRTIYINDTFCLLSFLKHFIY